MEDLKENIKILQDKIDNNATKIIENMNKLHSREEMINNNSEKIQQNSYALSFIKDYKVVAKGWKRAAMLFMILWIITIGYLVYILNDIGTIEETITQKNESGYNNYIGNDGEINNG